MYVYVHSSVLTVLVCLCGIDKADEVMRGDKPPGAAETETCASLLKGNTNSMPLSTARPAARSGLQMGFANEQ